MGLWGVSPAELNFYFHQIAQLAHGCRFRDCTHVHEPRCAVREAVETGELVRARYDSYLRIRQSLVE
jgi:ribosome biogenesis GTPase